MALLLFYLYRTSTKSFTTIFTHAVSYVYTVREMVNNDDRNRKKKSNSHYLNIHHLIVPERFFSCLLFFFRMIITVALLGKVEPDKVVYPTRSEDIVALKFVG